jgi:ferredoxin-NADP reductase
LPTPIKVAAKVVEITVHTDELRSYVLAPTRPIPAFAPGQFLHLAIDPFEAGLHWPDSRVYSIASSPTNRDRLRITVSRQGAFSSRLFAELRLGSEVWLKLPYGSFCPNADLPGRMVLLAGGSGITPFISFIEWATGNRPAAAIDLHYGARSSSLLIYRDVIERCATSGLRDLRVRYYLEQLGPGETLDDTQVVGRLSPDVAWNQLEAPTTARFYLSGPKAMINPFRERLVQLGANESTVLSDDWA